MLRLTLASGKRV